MGEWIDVHGPCARSTMGHELGRNSLGSIRLGGKRVWRCGWSFCWSEDSGTGMLSRSRLQPVVVHPSWSLVPCYAYATLCYTLLSYGMLCHALP